jgi:CBS domain-containing protein
MAWVELGTSITDCMGKMKAHSVRHLPVLTGPPSVPDSEIVGVISMGDILFVVMNGYVCPQCWAVEDARGSGDGYSE